MAVNTVEHPSSLLLTVYQYVIGADAMPAWHGGYDGLQFLSVTWWYHGGHLGCTTFLMLMAILSSANLLITRNATCSALTWIVSTLSSSGKEADLPL
jgi:hypothetical protein